MRRMEERAILFLFEKEMDFRYIEVMKQRMILKPDQIQRTVFNKDMKRSLEVLQLNNKDLQAFLMEISSHNPFLRYQASDEAQTDFTMFATQKPSLLDVMLEQNRFEKNSLSEDMIAYLTSMLDSNGYFKENLSSLVSQSIYTKKEIMQAIDQLRHMEPLGCYCFHLKESLKVQCEVSPHAASETGEILCDYLKELSSHDYSTIVEGTGLSLEEIEEGFQFIKSLNPKPGCNYAKDSIALQPEARVSVEQGQVLVEMINQDFELDVLEYSSRELKALRQEADRILNQVRKRSLTILQILQILCSYQRDFFVSGAGLKHCTLEQVAKECGLHVSTISRAIQGKSFEFKNRYYPIKKLLSHDGFMDVDAATIEEKIVDLIHAEDHVHPYSDAKLQLLLENQGIFIARRTIAKYREHCGILSSSKRKSKG